ncbi:MD-2-related lipid-recognition protein [Calliopsis andreniformis]|uniref:MD-2-related lipid-recognition protein n=1 Tax=Calliopsis andreniformis TaxID=337506 RepID=UPI003FCD76E3
MTPLCSLLGHRLPSGYSAATCSLRDDHPPRMNRHSELLFVFLVVAISAACAEVVPWRPCLNVDPNAPPNCTIHEVIVEPCKEAAEGKPCKLKRGIVSNVTAHYTPAFSTNNIQGRIFWASQVMDIPFLGLDPNVCLATTCPIVAGQRNMYHTEVAILKKYPVRMYDLKWRIWNEHQQECCFLFQIKIVK